MDIFYKTLPKRNRTNNQGVYFKEIEKIAIDDKGKSKTTKHDKVYMIRYEYDKKEKWVTVGKYSAGIREAYCVQKRNEILNKLRLGEEPPAIVSRKRKVKGATVNDVFEYYINNKDMKDKSRYDFNGRYDKHLRNTIGDEVAKDITAEQIISVRESVEGSLKTKEMLIQILGASFNYAIVNKYPNITNPVNRVRALDRANESRTTKKQKRTQREEYLKRDEIKQLREAIKDDFLSLLAVEILLSTGVRIGGALVIQKKDIDLEQGTVKLRDLKAGDVTYTGFISEPLRALLVEHVQKLGRNDYVLSRNGEPTPYKHIARPLKKVFDKLFNVGLKAGDSKNRIVLHSLRHTFASHLAMQNVPLYTIKDLLHHADISMTMRYAKLSQEAGQKAVSRLAL